MRFESCAISRAAAACSRDTRFDGAGHAFDFAAAAAADALLMMLPPE